MTEQQKCKNTERLLFGIVTRLSGRDDLKLINYRIKIDSKNRIKMTPLIYVYPDRHRRLESDRSDIVSFILNNQLNQRGDRSFVAGEYVYKSSDDGKRRQWTRLK